MINVENSKTQVEISKLKVGNIQETWWKVTNYNLKSWKFKD